MSVPREWIGLWMVLDVGISCIAQWFIFIMPWTVVLTQMSLFSSFMDIRQTVEDTGWGFGFICQSSFVLVTHITDKST